MWGGKDVVFGLKPELLNEIPHLEDYGLIILGTPIWLGSFAPPVNTFISKNIPTGRKIGFYACHAGGRAEKCFDKLRKIFKNNVITESIDFVNPIKDDKDKVRNEVKNWISKII